MVNAVLNNHPHALNEEKPKKYGDVRGCHGRGDGDEQRSSFREERQNCENDADDNTHTAGCYAGYFGK